MPEPGPGLPPGPGPGLCLPAPAPVPVCRPERTPDPSRARRTRIPEARAPGGHHPQAPTTTVSGSAQSGVTYAPGGAPVAMAGGVFAAPSAGSGVGAPLGTGRHGRCRGASAGMAMRGGARLRWRCRRGPVAAGRPSGGRSAPAVGPRREGSGPGRPGRTQRRHGPGAARAASRPPARRSPARQCRRRADRVAGRRKDRSDRARSELLATEDHWLDGEGTAPDVLR